MLLYVDCPPGCARLPARVEGAVVTLAELTARRVLKLEREVWALRRRVREQQARADLWRHRCLVGRKKAA